MFFFLLFPPSAIGGCHWFARHPTGLAQSEKFAARQLAPQYCSALAILRQVEASLGFNAPDFDASGGSFLSQKRLKILRPNSPRSKQTLGLSTS
jgi:hypothetical protein